MNINDIKKFPNPHYNVHIGFDFVEHWIEDQTDRGVNQTIDLNPDFQRGHVWTQEQQIAFIEFCLKEGQGSRNIYFNHPQWQHTYKGTMVLVDGKQRLEAVRTFMRNELPVFGGYKLNDFDDPKRVGRSNGAFLQFYVNTLQTRAELLEWYLSINSGGVVHTTAELEKVRQLLALEAE